MRILAALLGSQTEAELGEWTGRVGVQLLPLEQCNLCLARFQQEAANASLVAT